MLKIAHIKLPHSRPRDPSPNWYKPYLVVLADKARVIETVDSGSIPGKVVPQNLKLLLGTFLIHVLLEKK